MVRSHRLLVILALAALPAAVAALGLPSTYHAQSGREALQAARRSGKPIMLYFTQPDCAYCELVERLLATSTLRGTLVQNYHFVNVNLRREHDPVVAGLVTLFRVRGTPAFAFLTPKGEALCMFYGTIQDDDELAQINTTVQELARGAKASEEAHGLPSCRGTVSAGEADITAAPDPM